MSNESLTLYREALKRLEGLLEKVKETDLPEPTAVTLATASPEGRPMARTVLLRGLDERGITFFTNLGSRKGRQLLDNPHAALAFYWPPLAEQVLVEGTVELVSDAEADAYWATRPRESQIGGWASRQSERLPSRFTLLRRVVSRAARFGVAPIPRPPFWSGFRIQPHRIEFWSSRPARLHDRRCYQIVDGEWETFLLYP
ncbi:MAG: pyridoxamine 5'-phosphate oxidase [Proteobacteria bacterium]|nr:MAG: pyridoxamine 5'-phosphate oxidase [Pseudomonadota bacterium]QKK10887.1 MAG: pyridoxamine 5'-phosphate oxidase [Pseudomonadota bacterium]